MSWNGPGSVTVIMASVDTTVLPFSQKIVGSGAAPVAEQVSVVFTITSGDGHGLTVSVSGQATPNPVMVSMAVHGVVKLPVAAQVTLNQPLGTVVVLAADPSVHIKVGSG